MTQAAAHPEGPGRSPAIAQGEDQIAKVPGLTPHQVETQCAGIGPAMKDHVAALSLKPQQDVVQDVASFVLSSGMSPSQVAGTARICLDVGYRKDDLDVALGSALLLVALGEGAYSESIGYHLSQGFGTAQREDMTLAWYQAGLDAVDGGATPIFNPGQPERTELLRQATFGQTATDPATAPTQTALPLLFEVSD